MKPGLKYALFAVLAVLLFAGAAAAYKHLTAAATVPPSPPGSSSASSAGSEANGSVRKNQAPDFTVTDGSGAAVRLSDFFGQPIILNFWATWCPPCRSELPDFDKLYRQYGTSVRFMMIDLTDGYRETAESVKEFVSKNDYTFPVYYDDHGSAANAYRVSSIPFTVVIDKNGNMHKTHLGAMSAEAIKNLIQSVAEVK